MIVGLVSDTWPRSVYTTIVFVGTRSTNTMTSIYKTRRSHPLKQFAELDSYVNVPTWQKYMREDDLCTRCFLF